MDNNLPMQIVEFTAQGLEFVGVVVIGIGFIYAGFRALVHYKQKRPNPYDHLKVSIGRALQLGLEFLIAADIISTVTVEPTREKDSVPRIVDRRSNVFELVHCGGNRRLLALAGRE